MMKGLRVYDQHLEVNIVETVVVVWPWPDWPNRPVDLRKPTFTSSVLRTVGPDSLVSRQIVGLDPSVGRKTVGPGPIVSRQTVGHDPLVGLKIVVPNLLVGCHTVGHDPLVGLKIVGPNLLVGCQTVGSDPVVGCQINNMGRAESITNI